MTLFVHFLSRYIKITLFIMVYDYNYVDWKDIYKKDYNILILTKEYYDFTINNCMYKYSHLVTTYNYVICHIFK